MYHILSSWFLPTIRPSPGQLVSSYFLSNPSSAGLHQRLGFLPVAISEHWAGRPLKQGEEPVVCCVWQTPGPCQRAQSVFASLPSYQVSERPSD
jgi:hypothetical protein